MIISVSASDLHGTHGNNYIFTGFTDSADRVISVITMIAGRHIILSICELLNFFVFEGLQISNLYLILYI